MKKPIYAAILVVGVVVACIYVVPMFFASKQPHKTPEELRSVLEATSPGGVRADRTAAARSSSSGPSASYSSPAPSSPISYDRPAETSTSSLSSKPTQQDRLDAIAELGQRRDEAAAPLLLEAMSDPDNRVRGRAAAAMVRIMKADYHFSANLPEEERREILEVIKKDWDTYQRQRGGQSGH